MLIETVAIFGKKPRTRALTLRLAATDKYLIDIYAPSGDETNLYNRAARSVGLPPLSLLFSRNVQKTAWGADAVILDNTQLIPHLPEIAHAANDTAIFTFAGDLSDKQEETIQKALKKTSLTYLTQTQLKRTWPDFALNFG